MEYPDTPWGHLQRLKAKQRGTETIDLREEPVVVPEVETVTKKRKKKAKKKT